MQVGATAAAARDKLQKQQHTDGVKMGVDIAKHKAQMAQQQRQAVLQARTAQTRTPVKGE